MSTRSRIAKQDSTGRVTMIYCHSDGYPEYNGRLLLEHYQDEQKIDQLLALGDISFLAPTLGVKHPFDILFPVPAWESEEYALRESMVMAYHRDRDDPWDRTKPGVFASLRVIPKDFYEEYFYLRKNGRWMYSDHGTFTRTKELTADVCKIGKEQEAAK
jgi:hypothetical protein